MEMPPPRFPWYVARTPLCMLSGISLLCFTASYGVALALELTRLMFRSGIRGAVMLLFAAAGITAHTLYLIAQAMQTSPGMLPLSSWSNWYLLAAWLLAVIYIYLTFYHTHNPIGLFLLPLVLLLIAGAYAAQNEAPPPAGQAKTVWLWIHVLGFLLGTVTVFVGFATGVMYLAQSWRLKHKLPASSRLKLPSLEWLQLATARSLVVSMLLVAVGFVGGLVGNFQPTRTGGGLSWSDPVIWSSALLLGWLVAAVVFGSVYRPSREGRKVAYLTVASFLFLVLTLAVTLVIPAAHGKPGSSGLNHRDTETQRGQFGMGNADWGASGTQTHCLASASFHTQVPFVLSPLSCFRDPSPCLCASVVQISFVDDCVGASTHPTACGAFDLLGPCSSLAIGTLRVPHGGAP